jgi:hypothetical protein
MTTATVIDYRTSAKENATVLDSVPTLETAAALLILLAGGSPSQDWEAAILAEYRRRNPSSRGVSYYYYSRNGGTKAERSPIGAHGRSTSWCANWRRTVSSWNTELEGCNAERDAIVAEYRRIACA